MAVKMMFNSRFDASPYYTMAWTDTPANYDIVANAPGVENPQDVGRMCCAIMCGVAGNLVVTRENGTDVTIPFASGQTLLIQAKALKSTSTAENVFVMW